MSLHSQGTDRRSGPPATVEHAAVMVEQITAELARARAARRGLSENEQEQEARLAVAELRARRAARVAVGAGQRLGGSSRHAWPHNR